MKFSDSVAKKVIDIVGGAYHEETVLRTLGLREQSPEELTWLKKINSVTKSNDLWPVFNNADDPEIKSKASEQLAVLLAREFQVLKDKKEIGIAERLDLYFNISRKFSMLKRSKSKDYYEDEVKSEIRSIILIQLDSADSVKDCASVRYMAFIAGEEEIKLKAFEKGFKLSTSIEDFRVTATGRGLRSDSTEFQRCIKAIAEILQKEEDALVAH